MYTLRIMDDNSVVTTVLETIMQRSSGVDKIQILASRYYKGIDMSDATMLMHYLLPGSKRLFSLYLTPASDHYNGMDFLQYLLPANTVLTSEAGEVRVSFTMIKLEEPGGEPTAYTRKTQEGSIHITPIAPWIDYAPDELLTPLDQRLIALEARQKTEEALHKELFENMATDVSLDQTNRRIHLVSNKGAIGEGIPVGDLSLVVGDEIVGVDIDGVRDGVVHLDQLAPDAVKVVNLTP